MFKRNLIPFAMMVAVLCGLLEARPLHAQNTTGTLVGTVNDPTGAAVPNAKITVTRKATNDARTTVSSGSGEFQVLNLQPGEYRLDVESSGFKHYTRDPVEIQVELATRANVDMAVGAATETITITEQAPIIQSENASLGQVVEGKMVSEIPLNGRNVLALVGLIPGVVPQGSSSQNLTGMNVFAAGNYQIGGGTANQSSTLYDGAAVNSSYGNNTILVPTQDAVQEFRVQTSNNTAEYGNYTGGVINMTSKSGTNAIHGTAYEFVRNTIFNATPYFSKHVLTSPLAKNPYHQNQYGANVGFPIIKDKLFGFFDYQGYRQAQARLFNSGTASVPTAKMLQGDFSELCTTGFTAGICNPLPGGGSGTSPTNTNQVSYQLYDSCAGTAGQGQACPTNTIRTPFLNNQIPQSRFSTVAKNVIAFPYWGKPNVPGQQNNGTLQNFRTYAKSGGLNTQYNARLDFVLSQKQRMFTRYTLWNSKNIGANPYGNGLISGDPISPEAFTTQQLVFGDTYLFSPSLIGDLRVGWTRWNYVRTPGTLGYDPGKLGFAGNYMSTISALNNVPNSTTFPSFGVAGYTGVGTGYIFSINNNYNIAPVVTKTWKTHTFKMGADLRRLDEQYFQNNSAGGTYSFSSTFTSKDTGSSTSTSGNSFASFLLGYVASGTVQIAPVTYAQVYYQGYYFNDNWNITPKLTLTAGIRYEIPGTFRERRNNQSTFNPTEVNPLLGNMVINGKPVLGAFDLVNTPQHPAKGLRNEHFTDFSPRLGLAYRWNDKTVVRAGFGTFFVPSTLQFPESPVQAPNSYYNNVLTASLNSNQSPNVNIDNPFPTGIVGAPGRDPSYQKIFLGSSVNALSPNEDNGMTYQWNVAIQHQFPLGITLEAAYAALHGAHLPVSISINQVPSSVMNQAATDPACQPVITSTCFFTKQVPNPFNPALFTQGSQTSAMFSANNLYRPFPQYGGIANTGNYIGVSNYNSLQMKLEKRFSQGGTLLGSYTFSKLLANVESLTSWLETEGAAAGPQDTNNMGAEYSLSGYDSRQRLTVSYVYQLPFGRKQRFASNVSGVVDKLVSGWGVNGVTTFQEGNPMGLSATPGYVGTYSFSGSTRPNVVPGCNKKIGGPIQSRMYDLGVNPNAKRYFNPNCFTVPTPFTYGNEPREDAQLRGPGQANYDLALYKDTHLTERLTMQLRIESFNLFNRVQFGAPSATIGSATVGSITSQINDPRLLQVAGRISF